MAFVEFNLVIGYLLIILVSNVPHGGSKIV